MTESPPSPVKLNDYDTRVKSQLNGCCAIRCTYSSLSVLDLQLYGDLEALPVSSGLGDVVTNLLGRETKGTDLI